MPPPLSKTGSEVSGTGLGLEIKAMWGGLLALPFGVV